jgi:Tol biopolymer transport system component
MIGSRLGPYEITAKLGEGGMGEVYRATDPKLGREVAIKVLPQPVATDPAALERFEAEARAVAALSHPNILSIFDFGSSGETAYAVTELLEGKTLREQLESGALPLRKVVDFGAQIARGLAAAHERGVVHRDLKPANLFLTRDGRMKILDFGLAKQVLPGDGAGAPTLGPATAPGTVLGTVGYMSPEQVRGEPADERSDLFSLGAVLYEMATGRRAFERATAAETMTAILREEPADLESTSAAVPPGLARVIHHCLEKNPRERFRSAEDLAFALDSLAGGATSSASALSAPQHGSARMPKAWLFAAVGLLAAAGAFVAGRASRTAAPAAIAAVPSQPALFRQLTDFHGVETTPALSPDGKDVVYASDASGNLDLYRLRVGGGKATLLTADSPGDDWMPAFSPDGERIAFRSERDGGGIFVMGSTGESVRRLTDFGYDPSWSPDGREIVVAGGVANYPSDLSASFTDLWVVDVETGNRRLIGKGINAMGPRWAPHGQRIAFWTRRGTSGQRDIFTIAADGSQANAAATDITNDAALDWSPAWSPDGGTLYFSSNRGGTMNLWRVPIDEPSGKTSGEAQSVTAPSAWCGEVSFANDGRHFVYTTLDWRSRLVRAPFDPRTLALAGPAQTVFETGRPVRDHQLSRDGKSVVISQIGAQEDLAVERLDGGGYLRLTDDTFRDRGPSWSPDGKEILFYSDRSGGYELWLIHPDGSGLRQLTRQGTGSTNFPQWSPDGARIAYASMGAGWYMLDMRSPEAPQAPALQPAVAADADFWPLSWTRDGGRIAGLAVQRDGRVRGISVFDLAKQTYEAALTEPIRFGWAKWLGDNRHLVVRRERGITLLDTVTHQVRPLVSVGGYWIGESVDVSADDRWITWTETATEGDLWLAEMK